MAGCFWCFSFCSDWIKNMAAMDDSYLIGRCIKNSSVGQMQQHFTGSICFLISFFIRQKNRALMNTSGFCQYMKNSSPLKPLGNMEPYSQIHLLEVFYKVSLLCPNQTKSMTAMDDFVSDWLIFKKKHLAKCNI